MAKSSHIYVSVTSAPEGSSRATEALPEQTYHRPRNRWLFSVESHHTRFFGLGLKDSDPVHFAVVKGADTGVYIVSTHHVDSEPAIIGNILVAESTHTSPEQVHQLLHELLGQETSTEDDDNDPSHWIRKALHAMQRQKIAPTFDVDEFMTWARGYEANRIEDEAPALVAYPKIHEDHEKKASKYSFWITRPMADRVRKNDRGEALTYGGLM